MKKSSILLLNSFSKKEISSFSQFVESPYFNSDKNIILLWRLLKKNIIQKRDLDENWQFKIYGEIYGVKKKQITLSNKEKNMLNAKLSLLIGLARRFLVVEALNKKEVKKNELLFEELLNKKQLDMSYRQISKVKTTLLQQPLKDTTYYQHAYALENSLLNYFHQKRLLVKEDNIDNVNFQLDMQYILQKLQLHSTALSLARVADNKAFDFSSMHAVQPLLELKQYASQALVKLHSTVIELMQHDTEEHYFRLLEYLDTYESTVTPKDLNDFYTVASNFCIGKILKGKLKYNYYQYELYKIMNQKNLLVEDGLMDIIRLKNVVILSCRIKDFSWAKELVEKYESVIRHKDKKSVCHFNLGVIAFYELDYKKAISHFIRVKKVKDDYDINVRMMLAKSHYELDQEYDDRTMTIFRSTERFVSNHKTISSQHKKGFKNFIRILIKVYKLRYQIGKVTLEKIDTEIKKLDFISDKKWMIEKLREL